MSQGDRLRSQKASNVPPPPRRDRATPRRSGARPRVAPITARKLGKEAVVVALAQNGNARCRQASRERLARRDAQALVVQIGAVAFLGDEHLVGDGIEHDRGDDLAFALQRDGDREMRNAVHEVRRAVDRIDDEAVRLVRPFDRCRASSTRKP